MPSLNLLVMSLLLIMGSDSRELVDISWSSPHITQFPHAACLISIEYGTIFTNSSVISLISLWFIPYLKEWYTSKQLSTDYILTYTFAGQKNLVSVLEEHLSSLHKVTTVPERTDFCTALTRCFSRAWQHTLLPYKQKRYYYFIVLKD